MKLIIIVSFIYNVIFYVSCATHWVVTNDGKIQSDINSVFLIKKPYDLVSFLDQEKRNQEAETLYKKIVARKASIDAQWAQIDLLTNLESLYHSTDPNCQITDKDETNINLYASIATDGSFRQGITSKDFLLMDDLEDIKVPDCEQTFPLEFSMYTFEHLQAMRNRKNLSQHEEKDLIQYLSPGMDIDKFGSHIAYGLLKNKTSWLHHNLGAIYWRYKGNSYRALECARRAIVTAPRQYRDIPLLTAGGILHAARHSAEAAIILHTAIIYAPDQSRQHLALGNIYATLGDYKRSIACYDNCLKLSPHMEQAKAAKHAILCHQNIEETLITLQSKLQGILTDLQTYDYEQEAWLKLTESIYQNKDSENQYLGEWSNMFINGHAQTCTQIDGNSQILTCEVVTPRSHMLPPNLQLDVNVNLQMLKNIEKQARQINQQIARSKFLHGLNDNSQRLNLFEKSNSFNLFMESDKISDTNEKMLIKNIESDEWLINLNCKEKGEFMSDSKKYVPVFLLPDNKLQVFSDAWIFSKEKKISSRNPPICKRAHNSHTYFTSMLLQSIKLSTTIEDPDSDLMATLTLVTKHNDINEIRKLISIAMQSKTKELWIVHMISSLYWRVVGKFYESLNCAQSAFDLAPSEMKNIPLVNIASILHKFKHFDDALIAIKLALKIDPNESTANFLCGLLLHTVGNNHDALDYLKRAIKYNVHSMNDKTMHILKTIACNEI